MSHRSFAPALLVLVSVLWSLGGVLIKSVEWTPLAIAGMRSAIAVPVIVACVGWPRFSWSRQQIGGAVAYAATVLLFVLATRLTTAANAIFLQYTAPIYVALCGPWLLGETPRKSDWFIIAVALGGIALFFLDHLTLAGRWGNACALASGFALAVMVMLLRKQRDESPVAAVLLGNVLAAIVGLPAMLHGPYPDLHGWIGLVALGVLQLGVPYVIYCAVIKRVKALEAILINLLEPVLNPLWVMLYLGERPAPWAILGAALVLGAVLLRGVLMMAAKGRDAGDATT